MFEGKYWLLEHMSPSKIMGWLVLILKRHTDALHNLSEDEFAELGQILNKATKALSEELNCKKEYTMCFAEKENFNHIHFHLIAVPNKLPDRFKGSNILNLSEYKEDYISKTEIVKFCTKMKNILAQRSS